MRCLAMISGRFQSYLIDEQEKGQQLLTPYLAFLRQNQNGRSRYFEFLNWWNKNKIKEKLCCPGDCLLKVSLPHWQISQKNYFGLAPLLTFQKLIIAILLKLSFEVAPELSSVWLDISDVVRCKDSDRWMKISLCKVRLPRWHSSCPEGGRAVVQSQRKHSCGELSGFITCWSLRLTEWREYVSRIWIKHCNNVKKNPNTFPNLMFYLPL